MEATQPLQEDEIDLRELWNTLWSHKWFIILFSFLITIGSIFYALSLPNIYQSKAILAPKDSGASSGGGLSALAGLAGINIGGGGKVNTLDKMNALKESITFTRQIIRKHELVPLLVKEFDALTDEEKLDGPYLATKALMGKVTIASDKTSSLISVAAEDEDPELARKLVDIYVTEMSETMRVEDLRNIDEKIAYYDAELAKTQDAMLKQELSRLASALIQNKILAQSDRYYGFELLVEPIASDLRDKVKPKRSLIVIVAAVTSVILAIFLVFFREFLRNSEEKTVKSK